MAGRIGLGKIVSMRELKKAFPMMQEIAEVLKRHGFKHVTYDGEVIGGVRMPRDRYLDIRIKLPPVEFKGIAALASFYRK